MGAYKQTLLFVTDRYIASTSRMTRSVEILRATNVAVILHRRSLARQRYCRRLARYRNTLRVSADPVANPAAHTRAESRGSRPSKADAGERRTLCWSKPDS